jgi:hypothetical protein
LIFTTYGREVRGAINNIAMKIYEIARFVVAVDEGTSRWKFVNFIFAHKWNVSWK